MNEAVRNAYLEYERIEWLAHVTRLVQALRRRPNTLYDYNQLRQQVTLYEQHDGGVQIVPVRQIVGSVGRAGDFNRKFQPTHKGIRNRWEQVAKAIYSGVNLPVVELLKVGELYFVEDGHHRLSVMRHQGLEYIDAHVVEIRTSRDIQTTADLRQITAED